MATESRIAIVAFSADPLPRGIRRGIPRVDLDLFVARRDVLRVGTWDPTLWEDEIHRPRRHRIVDGARGLRRLSYKHKAFLAMYHAGCSRCGIVRTGGDIIETVIHIRGGTVRGVAAPVENGLQAALAPLPDKLAGQTSCRSGRRGSGACACRRSCGRGGGSRGRGIGSSRC